MCLGTCSVPGFLGCILNSAEGVISIFQDENNLMNTNCTDGY